MNTYDRNMANVLVGMREGIENYQVFLNNKLIFKGKIKDSNSCFIFDFYKKMAQQMLSRNVEEIEIFNGFYHDNIEKRRIKELPCRRVSLLEKSLNSEFDIKVQ